MTKELFNSPRYGKKGFFSDNKYWLIRTFTPLFTLPLVGCIIAVIFHASKNSLIDSIFEFSLYAGIASPIIAFFIDFLDFFKYKEYLKKIHENKDLFHEDGKSAYITPYNKELIFSPSSLQTSLTLRLLALVMKADKEERVREMDYAKAYIRYIDKSNYETRLTEFNSYQKEDYAVEDVAFAMYWWFEETKDKEISEDERYETLKFMFKMAYADGSLCEEEEFLLRYAAYHMRLTEYDYTTAIKKSLNDSQYEQYLRTRYKKEGGYWVRDKNGRKRWVSFQNESKQTETNTKTFISAELQKAYTVLSISVDASPSEINACKRNLLRRYHPDLVSYKGQEAIDTATIKTQEINQAYDVLKANGKC